jgi:hypothetical protein
MPFDAWHMPSLTSPLFSKTVGPSDAEGQDRAGDHAGHRGFAEPLIESVLRSGERLQVRAGASRI